MSSTSKTSMLWISMFTGLTGILFGMAHLILKPTATELELNQKKTKDFASFIEKRPELAQKPIASKLEARSIRETSLTKQTTLQKSEPGLPDPIRPLNPVEQMEFKNFLSDWSRPKRPFDYEWREQIEHTFKLVEATHDPMTLDLLKRELLKLKQSKVVLDQRYFENYRNQFLLLDHRKSTEIELGRP